MNDGAGGAASSSTAPTTTPSASSAGGGTGGGGSCAEATSPIPCEQMELWLDAASLTPGAMVANWPDKSPEHHSVVQSSPMRQPAAAADGPNGLVVAQFDGMDDYLEVGGNFDDFSTGTHVFAVIVPNPSDAQPEPVFYLGPDRADFEALDISLIFDGSGFELEVGLGGTGRTFPLTPGQGAFMEISTVPRLGGNQSDCTNMRRTNSVMPEVHARTHNFIATSPYPAVEVSPFKGAIAEVIIYSRPLGNLEAIDVREYLKTKWGVCR